MEQQNTAAFLGKFPSLNEWLGMNGFWMVHSTVAQEINTVMTLWTDQCRAENGLPQVSNTDNFLIITFCNECKTVEVYFRGFIGKINTEDAKPFALHSFKENVTSKIERILQEAE